MPKKFNSAQEKQTYQTWSDMKSRCYNPNYKRYHQYGGSGITVCKRWQSYALFEKDLGLKPLGTSLGRKDKRKNYTSRNCCWMTYKENNFNKKDAFRITYKGKTQGIQQWAEELGINRSTLSERIHKYGWDPIVALTAPLGHKVSIPDDPEKAKYLPKLTKGLIEKIKQLYAKGTYSKTALAKKFGLSRPTIRRALNYLEE